MDVCQEGPEMALMTEAVEEEARTHIIYIYIYCVCISIYIYK